MSRADTPDKIADLLRRSGLDNVNEEQRAILRAHAATLTPRARVRLRIPWGDNLIEGPIDDVWAMLDRQPTAEEYREIANLCGEAAAYCKIEAAKADEREKSK